jgi:hypothetical protein
MSDEAEVESQEEMGAAATTDEQEKEKNVLSLNYIGIPCHFWNVGLLSVGSIAVLYPVLVIEYQASSTVYAGASQLVTLFYSYQIFFGIFTDTVYIRRQRWKPYILLAWILSSAALLSIVILGKRELSVGGFVWALTLSNVGAAIADTAASGQLTYISRFEPVERKGHTQALMYILKESGRLLANIVILFGFSGPINCEGYPEVTACADAIFSFDLSLSQYAAILFAFAFAGVIFTIPLKEEKATTDRDSCKELRKTLSNMWQAAQNKAVWQLMLFTLISNTLFMIRNIAQYNANYVWLGLNNFQNQIVWLMENIVFIVGLALIKKYFINTSWRKLNLIGMGIVSTMNLLYLLIIYDVTRNVWFYVIFSTSESFMFTANFLVNVFCIIEVAPANLESVTYALITSTTTAAYPLATALSIALMSFFPILNEQDSFAEDTPAVRNAMASLTGIIVLLNWSGILAMPMLPRQRAETRKLVKKKEVSKLWAALSLLAGLAALIYTTIVTVKTSMGSCGRVFGGAGCEGKKEVGLYVAMCMIFGFCYLVPFYHIYLPILKGKEKFSFSMFV